MQLTISTFSSETINQYYFKELKKWMSISGDSGIDPTLIYGGDTSLKQNEFNVVSWMDSKMHKGVIK